QDLLPRGHVRRCARRGDARAAQRPRGRDRLVRHGARAVPDRPRRAREDRVRRGDGADPRGGHRRARRAGARRRREGARGAAADAWPRLRVAAQAHVRHRRLRAGRGPRLRARARGRRAARRPTALNAVVSAPSTMIEVAGLRVVLPPDVVAVDGVDLVIRPGEFVVVLGRSGAGKTTFLRALNRLVEPTAGTVRVAGRAVTGAGVAELREIRRQIGMVFQQFNLVRRASVIENVLAGRLGYVPPLPSVMGRFPADDRALARACLAQVGLAHLADRRADTLSGGEQQRVAIARALAQRPAVILADEPTASLDPALTGSIMDILKTINVEHGLTLVVSQHQLETALAYATRIVGVRQGRVDFDGRPAAVTPAVVHTIYGDGRGR